jgi:hypothetical protein
MNRIGLNPAPSANSFKRCSKKKMDLTNGPVAERFADVRSASRVACVAALRAVVCELLRAVVATASEFSVVVIESLGVQRATLKFPDQGANVVLGVALECATCALGDVHVGEVDAQDLVDGGLGPRVLLLVDLDEQSSTDLLRFLVRVGPVWHVLDEVVAFTGEPILSGGDADSPSSAR